MGDPALTLKGTRKQVKQTLDAVLVWWQVLGLPLSWANGAYFEGHSPHVWIGVLFTLLQNGFVAMESPKPYLLSLDALLEPLARGTCSLPLKEADKIVGKAGRLCQIIKGSAAVHWRPVRSVHRFANS